MWPCYVFGAHMCRTRAVVCVTRVQVSSVCSNHECAMFGHVLPRGAVDNSQITQG